MENHNLKVTSERKEIDTSETRNRLWAELSSHIGGWNAIGMAALYQAVYNRPWNNRINDTRALRILITTLREEGKAICSVATSTGGGYYLPAVGSELTNYLDRLKYSALKRLRRYAKMKNISLPNLYGQLKLESEGGNNDEAA
jgi:hypothetical protein